ncbi:TetR/AcrR family transcriptional regulator [Pseudonocardia sp. MH-G8]|uniref:TetR/AcrR family transcriptional regulator n=1 Tax=Pseudonocardia sp. MH-G8 TaxID=1854588 RepID=UPI000BA1857A|nr:TetR family transcriptional regulator [Pseudonocardia sp. MH-G8]OZM83958.1 TetR family transcriptional regulator [Pseudonocardia sp. MH-G8]
MSKELAAAFLRARRPEQKQLRYAAILDAARELAERDGVGAVSLTGIAAQVGMHKSALLKYFETREEIFLRLAETEWREWAAGAVAALPAAGPAPHDVADALARSVADRPLFCQLLLHSPLTLERNVSIEVVRAFKQAIHGAMVEVQRALQQALPALDADACTDLLMTSGLVAAGLWQTTHPPPQVAAVYAEQAGTYACPDFTASLTRFVRVHLTGLLRE